MSENLLDQFSQINIKELIHKLGDQFSQIHIKELMTKLRSQFSQINVDELIQKLLDKFSHMNPGELILSSLLITILGTGLLYVFLSCILRPIFRKFETDIAIVSLNISIYPTLIIFAIFSIKIIFDKLAGVKIFSLIEHIFTTIIIITIGFWVVQIFDKVFIYYLKQYTQKTEAMWDDVLLPLLRGVLQGILHDFLRGVAQLVLFHVVRGFAVGVILAVVHHRGCSQVELSERPSVARSLAEGLRRACGGLAEGLSQQQQ